MAEDLDYRTKQRAAEKKRRAARHKVLYATNEEYRAKFLRGKAEQKKRQKDRLAVEEPEELRRRNKAKRDAYYRLHTDKYRARNAEKNVKYLRHRKQAIPAWANKFFIEEAYALSRLRTEMFGFTWEVDHIVPLRSPLVCGLHVEHNLAVVPQAINRAKSNRHWPDMPE